MFNNSIMMRLRMFSNSLAFLLLTLFISPVQPSHNSTRSDEMALLAFKNSLSVDPLNSLHDWTPHRHFCTWKGVVCSSHPHRVRVVSLNLTGMGLYGPISPFIGNLSFLRVLDLWRNSFHGQIPSQLGRLFRLYILRLARNKLEGSIPSALAGCRSLQILVLSYNQLSGTIPSQLGLLPNLSNLLLGSNQFTGTVPAFTSLSLIQLEIGENRLRGNIPSALSNCSHLRYLHLGGNQLIGHIPWEFGSKLLWLKNLILWGNRLSGEIPSSLPNCTHLQLLELDRNQLTGTIPMELGKLIHLRVLSIGKNNFVRGSSKTLLILTALNNCSYLQAIVLSGNFVSGILPSSIGQLSPELYDLELDSNEFYGNIPNEIGNLTSLTYLGLEFNSFSGAFPSGLNGLTKLERLYLNNNKLCGKIPNNWGYLKRLGLLDLSNNMLSGQIPNSLGQLPQLRDLYLHHNQLSGEIPTDLGRCFTLERLDLAHNKLTGSIPSHVAGLSNLQFYFNLSNNLLKGILPLEMSKMVMVQAIDVSHNHLSGGIPSVLSSCIALQYLNLSWNAFEGTIPPSLAKLKNLEVMDLSSNFLNGTIPMTLEEMKTLQHLNLSSNKLIGEVPKHGIFSRLNASAIMKNLGLCGTWIGLSPCSHFKHKNHWLLKNVIIPVVIVIAVVIICSLFLGLLRRRKCSSLNPHAFGPTMISYKELVDATSGFSEANLIGTGSFGAVYKGMLNNGTCIAVKVLNLQDENAYQSFQKECDVLKRVRHRNVIRIITSCSNHEFKSLVFPFMSNGSLERWLYPKEGDGCVLDMNERLRIAMDIALGMEYLHHHCFVQVIHCDLKPSNVLLGDDMTAYLADFGISKLVFGNSMESLSSTSALKGSIGYIAPEYGVGRKVCSNGDVYSYGVLLLELLTRKRPTDNAFLHGMNLPNWVNMSFPNRITKVVDGNMLKDLNEPEVPRVLECLTQLLQVGLVCANESPQERPTMIEITKRLEKIKATFLGETKTFELPLDISTLLEKTGGKRNIEGSDQSWTSFTT